MRCPKCQYVTFEAEERCRNCGHSFALPASEVPDVSIWEDQTVGPLMELTLRPEGQPPNEPFKLEPETIPPETPAELPLFAESTTPAVTPPAPSVAPGPQTPPSALTPRPPLAVRRTPAEVPRITPEPQQTPLRSVPTPVPAPAPVATSSPTGASPSSPSPGAAPTAMPPPRRETAPPASRASEPPYRRPPFDRATSTPVDPLQSPLREPPASPGEAPRVSDPFAEIPVVPSTPTPPGMASSRRTSRLGLDLPLQTSAASEPIAEEPRSAAREPALSIPTSLPSTRDMLLSPAVDDSRGAPMGPRLMAAGLDVAFVGGLYVIVLYLTARVAGVAMGDLPALPRTPLIGFLLMLAFGYLWSFVAASGQTIGMMTAAVRVVDEGGEPVRSGQAALRALGAIAAAASLGLLFLPAFFDPDRRAAHDRLAGTLVVGA